MGDIASDRRGRHLRRFRLRSLHFKMRGMEFESRLYGQQHSC